MPLHAYTRTHAYTDTHCTLYWCECASRAFVCVRTCVVNLKAGERETERRRDGGHAREKEGQGESGARRDCVCERGGVCWHARSQ